MNDPRHSALLGLLRETLIYLLPCNTCDPLRCYEGVCAERRLYDRIKEVLKEDSPDA